MNKSDISKTNEIDNLRRQINKLNHELEEIRNSLANEMTEISPREKAIINYVRLNPGANKQQVIDWGTSLKEPIGSRVTIMNAIVKLCKSGIIKIEKDKPNSIVHKLYINKESALVFVIEELDTFENIFPALIKKIKAKLKVTDLGAANISYSENEVKFVITFFVLYQQFIGMLVLHAIYTWPARLNDEYTLKRLYAILFTWLSRVQLNLTNAFKTDNPSNYSVDVPITMAQLWFVMKPSDMKYFYDMAKEYDSLEEAEKLLDTVWKVSRPFFKYSIWAHSPLSKAQKGDSYVSYKDTNRKKLREIDPKDWRVLLRE